MINILPLENQASAKKEFYRRLIVVIGIFTFGIACSAIILLAPSYLLLSSRKQSFGAQISALKEIISNNDAQTIESSVNVLNEKLNLLSDTSKNQRKISSLLKQIADIRPTTIKLTTFSYNGAKEEKNLSIKGNTATRNSFLSFLDALSSIKEIRKVISPPSNLLKEEDVFFKVAIELSP